MPFEPSFEAWEDYEVPENPEVYLADVQVLRRTDKAVKVAWNGQELWVPLSQVGRDPCAAGDLCLGALDVGAAGNLIVSQWWAHQRSLFGLPSVPVEP
jgi:hypothetical protein